MPLQLDDLVGDRRGLVSARELPGNAIFSRENKKPPYYRFCAFVKIASCAIIAAENNVMASQPKIPGRKVPRSGYTAFVPAPLPPKLDLTPRLIRVLSDADRLIGQLAGEGGRLPNPHVLMRPFVKREAVLSSKIEGTQATLGELLAAEAGATVDRSPDNLAHPAGFEPATT